MEPLSPFAEGMTQGVIRYQRCMDCNTPQTLSRLACTLCGSVRLRWCDSKGEGAVYATTIVMRAPSQAFSALTPYTLLLVELDEGFRLMAHGTPGLAIGARVHARFAEHSGGPLIVFHPEGDDAYPLLITGDRA